MSSSEIFTPPYAHGPLAPSLLKGMTGRRAEDCRAEDLPHHRVMGMV
jgi:hypothetical protein